MTIFWDTTKANRNRVYSGLNRVSRRLQKHIHQSHPVQPVVWVQKKLSYCNAETGRRIQPSETDAFITPELFSENERPGIMHWIRQCPARTAAIFHDAIPLKYPEFTWPKSVARHPAYLKSLARFDLIFANSRFSRQELLDYWKWLGLETIPPVHPLPLGADFSDRPRVSTLPPDGLPLHLLVIGILEPRKNHETLLGAAEILHDKGLDFRISLVGRVNPHFGKPILKRIENLIRRGLPIEYFRQLRDPDLQQLFRSVHCTVVPSLAEGNGLPVIESIWSGRPALVSPIPAHQEHTGGGDGVIPVDPMNAETLAGKLEAWIRHPDQLREAVEAAQAHRVPTWSESARIILEKMEARS